MDMTLVQNVPESHRWKLCEKKRKYSSEKCALKALKSFRKKGLIIPPNAAAYQCPFEDSHWHLGHKKDIL